MFWVLLDDAECCCITHVNTMWTEAGPSLGYGGNHCSLLDVGAKLPPAAACGETHSPLHVHRCETHSALRQGYRSVKKVRSFRCVISPLTWVLPKYLRHMGDGVSVLWQGLGGFTVEPQATPC